MRSAIVRFFLNIWLKIPFGYICRVHHETSHMTLRKDYWVIVTSGKSTDALPITFVSHHLQHEFALRMKAIGYDVGTFFDDQPTGAESVAVRDRTQRDGTAQRPERAKATMEDATNATAHPGKRS